MLIWHILWVCENHEYKERVNRVLTFIIGGAFKHQVKDNNCKEKCVLNILDFFTSYPKNDDVYPSNLQTVAGLKNVPVLWNLLFSY